MKLTFKTADKPIELELGYGLERLTEEIKGHTDFQVVDLNGTEQFIGNKLLILSEQSIYTMVNDRVVITYDNMEYEYGIEAIHLDLEKCKSKEDLITVDGETYTITTYIEHILSLGYNKNECINLGDISLDFHGLNLIITEDKVVHLSYLNDYDFKQLIGIITNGEFSSKLWEVRSKIEEATKNNDQLKIMEFTDILNEVTKENYKMHRYKNNPYEIYIDTELKILNKQNEMSDMDGFNRTLKRVTELNSKRDAWNKKSKQKQEV